jgi:hypothetical protein
VINLCLLKLLICSYYDYRWAHVGLAFLNLLQIAVVSRKNIAFGIPDRVMVLFGSALVDGINQFKFVTASHFSFFSLSYKFRFIF